MSQKIKKANELTDNFNWLMENESNIKKQLTDILPEYKARINNGTEALKAL